MKTRSITINGKTFMVAFTLKTLMNYEQITDTSFFGATFNKLYERIAIILAAILTVNEDADVTLDDFLNINSAKGVEDILTAFVVINELSDEFFATPKIEPKPEQSTSDEAKN